MEKNRRFEAISDKFKKNEGKVKIPTRSDNKSSGYDFYMPHDIIIAPFSYSKLIFTDIKAYMQDDEELLLFIRSSLGIKKAITLSNNVGKIDASYYNNPENEGNIGFKLYNNSDTAIIIYKGERVIQGTFYKFLIADNDEYINNERKGGLGHSGK